MRLKGDTNISGTSRNKTEKNTEIYKNLRDGDKKKKVNYRGIEARKYQKEI